MKTKFPLVLLISCFALTGCRNDFVDNQITNPELKSAILKSPMTDEVVSKPESYDAFLKKVGVFSARFTQSIIKNEELGENISISPVSIFLALAMCVESANGQSKEEILTAFDMTYEELSNNIKYFCASLNNVFTYETIDSTKQYGQIKLTNSVWLDKSLTVKEKCLSVLADLYKSFSFEADFSKRNKNANKLIREFIKEQTNGLIDQSLNLDTSTLVVLLNTLYFKDTWNDIGRDLDFTKDQYVFRTESGNSFKQNFLVGPHWPGRAVETSEYRYFYIGTNMHYNLTFVVPKGNNTLKSVMDSCVINDMLNTTYPFQDKEEMKEYYTACYFPEFKASFDKDVSANLINDFGIKTVFDSNKSDLSNLCEEKLVVDSIRHITKFNVTKSGIEGAAITAIVEAGANEPLFTKVYETFVVDRSFGYIFSKDNTVIFSGIVDTL